MADYSDVDPVIEKWAAVVGSTTLVREWPPGTPARGFYIPGDPPFECFQITIDPPNDGNIAVHAWTVDTNDDDDFEAHWTGPVVVLDAMLGAAYATIMKWKRRVRKKPDPPSPW